MKRSAGRQQDSRLTAAPLHESGSEGITAFPKTLWAEAEFAANVVALRRCPQFLSEQASLRPVHVTTAAEANCLSSCQPQVHCSINSHVDPCSSDRSWLYPSCGTCRTKCPLRWSRARALAGQTMQPTSGFHLAAAIRLRASSRMQSNFVRHRASQHRTSCLWECEQRKQTHCSQKAGEASVLLQV